jgi:glycosyltransferase 2 family protein
LRNKQVIQFLIIFTIGGFFLYFVFKGIQWSDLSQKLADANYAWIALGMAIGVFSHLIRAWRATMLYKPMGYEIGVLRSFYAVMVGYMMNYIIPRAGELSRCAALSKTDDIPVQKSLGTVVTERIVDMVFLLILLGLVFVMNIDLLLSFLQQHEQATTAQSGGINIKWVLALLSIGVAVMLFMLRKKITSHPIYKKISDVVAGFAEGLLSIKHVKQPILFIVLSAIIWLCYVLMMYFCLFAMSATANLTFMNTLVVFAIGTIGMIIPAPAAGAGTYHFAVMQSLLLFGVPEADGIAYATIVHGVQMIVLVLIGAFCSIPVFLINRKNKNA